MSDEQRRSYPISIIVNGIAINEVIIDPHYETSHSESISDEIILKLVQKLNGKTQDPDQVDDEYQYFKTEPVYLDDKKYRLIWLLKDHCLFIGVINAFRKD